MNFDLYNITQNELVIKDVCVASSFWLRFIGLMFRESTAPYGGLVFYRSGGIHTCFMRFALDIVFVDCGMKVTRVFTGVKPFRAVFCPGAYAAIEFKSGSAKSINRGDILEFKNG